MKKSSMACFTQSVFLFLLTISMLAASAQTDVKNIVLVHGAFADGSGWEGVYNLLTKKGYRVSVAANPNTGFADDVAAVDRALSTVEGKAILVGHSYGGAIITQAGNNPKVAGLVYVAAFAPAAGENLLKLLQSGPPAPNSGILPPDANGYVWYDKSKFHAGFCADLPKEKAAFMADAQVPVSASVFGAAITEAAWTKLPSWFIVAKDDQTIPPDAERYMAKRINATTTEIKGSHVVFISQPKAVADVIETAAKNALTRK